MVKSLQFFYGKLARGDDSKDLAQRSQRKAEENLSQATAFTAGEQREPAPRKS